MGKKFKGKKGKQVESWYAYTDESGNTGENLFDEAQPMFWTGTILSRQDLDVSGAGIIHACKSTLGVQELHGTDLGFSGIAKIAGQLEELINRCDCSFVFTLTEKAHRAAIRLAEMLFDSDYNKAVSPMHDLGVPLRRMLTLPVIDTLTRGDKQQFWEAYINGDFQNFSTVLEKVQRRIYDQLNDPRGRQLLLDAISWALRNPQEVLRPKPPKSDDPYCLDSPNMQAFMSLIDGLHDIVNKLGARVVRFHHDDQKEFRRAIKETFDILHEFQIPRDSLLVQKIKTFNCPIQLVPSHSSVGLQVIDVCLWLMTRAFKTSQAPESAECRSLLGCIIGRAIIKECSYEQLVEDCKRDYARLMRRDLTPEQLAEARTMQEGFESRRLRRMTAGTE